MNSTGQQSIFEVPARRQGLRGLLGPATAEPVRRGAAVVELDVGRETLSLLAQVRIPASPTADYPISPRYALATIRDHAGDGKRPAADRKFRILASTAGGSAPDPCAVLGHRTPAAEERRPEAESPTTSRCSPEPRPADLVALSLTAPDPQHPSRPAVTADELASFYVEDGPGIFTAASGRIRTLWGWLAPSTRSARCRTRSSGASGRPRSRTRSAS